MSDMRVTCYPDRPTVEPAIRPDEPAAVLAAHDGADGFGAATHALGYGCVPVNIPQRYRRRFDASAAL